MARLNARPKDYEPQLELSLRREKEGGKLRDPAAMSAVRGAELRRECLVLVHGFNNNDGEAAHAYVGFRKTQDELFADISGDMLEKRLADVFWPGDGDFGVADLADAAVYPWVLDTATDAGRVLAEALRQKMPQLHAVDFIGHSLGCRVVLSAIGHLLDAGRPLVRRVCLMAAAVPCEAVEPGGAFHATLTRLQAAGGRVHVLHSKDDRVLRFAFPPGQLVGGEPSIRALGRVGPPPAMPGWAANVTEAQIAGADHSHYWGHIWSAAVPGAAKQAGVFLKIGSLAREIAPREVGSPQRVGFDRDVGADRAIGD